MLRVSHLNQNRRKLVSYKREGIKCNARIISLLEQFVDVGFVTNIYAFQNKRRLAPIESKINK